MDYPLASIAPILVTIIISTLAPYAFASSRPKNFPPGPPTVPFLGNLHLVPPTKGFTKYVKVPIYTQIERSSRDETANAVILNNYRDVHE